MLSTGREDCVEGTFSTFVKLCEDCQDQLDSEEMEPVLNQLIQVLNKNPFLKLQFPLDISSILWLQ